MHYGKPDGWFKRAIEDIGYWLLLCVFASPIIVLLYQAFVMMFGKDY